jgi:3-oxoadipate enol-lactonase
MSRNHERTTRLLPRRTGSLARDGDRLYFEVCGEGAVPLVLCHGAGGNHAVWYQQVARFAAQRAVVTWDHRGFGRSDDHSGRSGPRIAIEDLAALLDHLELDRVDLVGQSMGGWTALGLAVAAPGRVRRLVLADTLGGLSTSRIRHAIERQAASGPEPTRPGQLGRHPALDDAFGERNPAGAHLYQMLGGFGEPDLARILPALLSHSLPAEAPARLGIPLLFVVGERDRLFPPALVREAAALVPGSRVVEIAGCGHSPYFEKPEQWNEVVSAFLYDA